MGYYQTDYPKGAYTQEDIDEMNERMGVSKVQGKAMKILCSQASDGKKHGVCS